MLNKIFQIIGIITCIALITLSIRVFIFIQKAEKNLNYAGDVLENINKVTVEIYKRFPTIDLFNDVLKSLKLSNSLKPEDMINMIAIPQADSKIPITDNSEKLTLESNTEKNF